MVEFQCWPPWANYITPELTGKWPGYLSPSFGIKFEDIPNGLGAVSKVPVAGWFQLVLCAILLLARLRIDNILPVTN